jgi:hypothetical protein
MQPALPVKIAVTTNYRLPFGNTWSPPTPSLCPCSFPHRVLCLVRTRSQSKAYLLPFPSWTQQKRVAAREPYKVTALWTYLALRPLRCRRPGPESKKSVPLRQGRKPLGRTAVAEHWQVVASDTRPPPLHRLTADRANIDEPAPVNHAAVVRARSKSVGLQATE